MTPQDKDNIKSSLDMFEGKYDRTFVQKVYLMNNKEFELTLDMFLTENLPEVDAKPQLTIVETEREQKGSSFMINTTEKRQPAGSKAAGNTGGIDMRSYVLDEYKEVLFPKKLTK